MEALLPTPPFIGRRHELAQLHALRSPVFLLGPPGVGKSALITEAAKAKPLVVARHCGSLSELLPELEPQAGLEVGGLLLPQRQRRLLGRLAALGWPVVFDDVGWMHPRVAHLMRALLDHVPVWLAARSSLRSALGHGWPYLFAFTRLELKPFAPAETRALLLAVATTPDSRARLLSAAASLHELSGGNPGRLLAALEEIRLHNYDVTTPTGRRLLALDLRIREATGKRLRAVS